jgi:hypothetical protein
MTEEISVEFKASEETSEEKEEKKYNFTEGMQKDIESEYSIKSEYVIKSEYA